MHSPSGIRLCRFCAAQKSSCRRSRFTSEFSIFVPLEKILHVSEGINRYKMELVIHKSRKKAVCFTVAGFAAGIAGGLVLAYVHDVVLGWCLVLTAVFSTLYGIGTLFDRMPYLVLTERGILETHTIGEEIGWEDILYADDFYFRGQYWVRLLLDRRYRPELLRPSMFRRFDRLYEAKGLRAVYIQTMGLEIDSGRLTALIRKMTAADPQTRHELLKTAAGTDGRRNSRRRR